jgi:hypothetical protein
MTNFEGKAERLDDFRKDTPTYDCWQPPRASPAPKIARCGIATEWVDAPIDVISVGAGSVNGTVQRTVFAARHAGLWSGGMGTVSDGI